ncbi:MAG: hypothetical protein GX652_14850 [Burkholderiaceae bacterium]|nr:hypothetical protein [Burkholderiaceae bacterium]
MQSEAPIQDSSKPPYARVAIGAVLGILLIQAIAGWFIYSGLPKWDERGQFGDMFGVVNSFFSGLAFVGIIYTIYLQQQELALQRQELALTRQEVKKQADATERLVGLQEKQQQNATMMLATEALTNSHDLVIAGLDLDRIAIRLREAIDISTTTGLDKVRIREIEETLSHTTQWIVEARKELEAEAGLPAMVARGDQGIASRIAEQRGRLRLIQRKTKQYTEEFAQFEESLFRYRMARQQPMAWLKPKDS